MTCNYLPKSKTPPSNCLFAQNVSVEMFSRCHCKIFGKCLHFFGNPAGWVHFLSILGKKKCEEMCDCEACEIRDTLDSTANTGWPAVSRCLQKFEARCALYLSVWELLNQTLSSDIYLFKVRQLLWVDSRAGGLKAEEYKEIVRLHLFAIPWRIMARSVQDLKGRGDQTKQFY